MHDPHGIPGRCFQCASGHGPWGPDHAIQDLVKQKDLQQALQRFHIISKRKWAARAKAAKGQLMELRGGDFSQIMNLVEARMTRQMQERGEERKIAKRHLVREAKVWFNDTAADIKKQIKEQQIEIKRMISPTPVQLIMDNTRKQNLSERIFIFDIK